MVLGSPISELRLKVSRGKLLLKLASAKSCVCQSCSVIDLIQQLQMFLLKNQFDRCVVEPKQLFPISGKQDTARTTFDINRRPAGPDARKVIGGARFRKFHIRQFTRDRAAQSTHLHIDI